MRILMILLIMVIPALIHAKAKETTAIVVATDSELKAVMSQMKSVENKTSDGIIFIKGKLNDHSVVVTKSNPGKINATYTATLAFDRFEPDRLIMIGLAGALNPKISSGSTFIASRVIEHDRGELIAGIFGPLESDAGGNGIDMSRSPLFNAAMSNALSQGISLTPAVLLTGDTFISTTAKRNQLQKMYSGDIVDMEGFAVATVCEMKKKDCAILRIVSDTADDKAHRTYEGSKSNYDGEMLALLKAVLTAPEKNKTAKKQTRK